MKYTQKEPYRFGEPVWNGGNAFVTITQDKVSVDGVWIAIDYTDSRGNKKYPGTHFLTKAELIKNVSKERWGISYRVYLDELYSKNVPHDQDYHAEILIEGEIACTFTSATGNNMDELVKDVQYELELNQARQPKVVGAYYKPNSEQKDITNELMELI
jgi:hypothetical protein